MIFPQLVIWREREKGMRMGDRERRICVYNICLSVCVCVCVKKKEKEKERGMRMCVYLLFGKIEGRSKQR